MQPKAKIRSTHVCDATSLVAWPLMESRTVSLRGRRARVRLEANVWQGLDEVARREGQPIEQLCLQLDKQRLTGIPLTNAIRVFVLDYFRGTELR